MKIVVFPLLFQLHWFSQTIDVYAYPFFTVLAILIVTFGGLWFATRQGMPTKPVMVILVCQLVSVFVGARLLHVLTNSGYYLADWHRIFALNFQGFALYGGALLAVGVGYVACRLLRINPWRLGDVFIPFVGFGVMSMRVGCLLNGCCFGKGTDLFFGITYPLFSSVHRYQLVNGTAELFRVQPVYPTQIFELVVAGICSVVALIMLKKKAPDGMVILVFVFLFTLFRLCNSFLRELSLTFALPVIFYPVVYCVLLIFLFGCFIFKSKSYFSSSFL